MTRDIPLSDEVYRKLKRETGDRRFSEVIEASLGIHRSLAEVTGEGIFDVETHEEVKTVSRRLSGGTLERVDDESL